MDILICSSDAQANVNAIGMRFKKKEHLFQFSVQLRVKWSEVENNIRYLLKGVQIVANVGVWVFQIAREFMCVFVGDV